jgi:hypothetical protein
VRARALLVAIASVVILVGCGDDDESTSAAGANGGSGKSASIKTSSLSKEQFIEQANAICRREKANYSEEITASLTRVDPKLDERTAALRAVQQVLVPITEAQIAGIRKLGAPEGDEDEIGAALAAQEESLAEIEQLNRLEPGEVPTDRFVEPTSTFQDYGLDDCVFFP